MGRNKPVLSYVLATTIVLTEIVWSTEWQGQPHSLSHAAANALPPSMPDNPHSHVDAEPELIDVSSGYSVSGGQRVVGSYELYLEPHFGESVEGKNTIVWVDAVGRPDGLSGTQRMYARFQSLDQLVKVFAGNPFFGEERLVSLREAVLRGPTIIGGSRAPVRFFFTESQLIGLGMSFSLPEA